MTEVKKPYTIEPPPGPRVGICGGCRVPSFTEMMVLARSGIAPGEPGHGAEFAESVVQRPQ